MNGAGVTFVQNWSFYFFRFISWYAGRFAEDPRAGLGCFVISVCEFEKGIVGGFPGFFLGNLVIILF